MPPLQKQQQFLRSTGIGRTFAQILMHIHMNREVLKAILFCAVGHQKKENFYLHVLAGNG